MPWRSLLPLGALAALAACSNARPPATLAGEWGRSQAACAAGLVIRFDAHAVRAQTETGFTPLLSDPEYTRLAQGRRIRIDYALDQRPGGVNARLGRGVLVYELRADVLHLVQHRFRDLQTGSTRASIAPAQSLSGLARLERCTLRAEGYAIAFAEPMNAKR